MRVITTAFDIANGATETVELEQIPIGRPILYIELSTGAQMIVEVSGLNIGSLRRYDTSNDKWVSGMDLNGDLIIRRSDLIGIGGDQLTTNGGIVLKITNNSGASGTFRFLLVVL